LEFTNHHRRAAKTRAAALIHTRPSKLTTEAPLVALVDLVVGVVEAAESVSVIEEGRDEELDELGIVAATRVELALVAGETAGADADALVESDVAKLGAATAVEGSTRAPTPQGMASPDSGWVALGGAVVWPEEDAMANRPVHVWLAARGAENW
jgi:hypothetical protein